MKRTHKELFILLLSFSIIFGSCMGAFFAVPENVYAADQWEDVTNADLVTAFRYYCKSRNLAVEGSVADAVTSVTTDIFNDICSSLSIDQTVLQANLKKSLDENWGLRFLFTQAGVNVYNRIFAEFLQNNDLSVGDENINKVIYSGRWWSDDLGNGCYVFVTNGSNVSFESVGTAYRGFDKSYFSSLSSASALRQELLASGQSYSYYIITQVESSYTRTSLSSTNSYGHNVYIKFSDGDIDDSGYASVRFDRYSNKLYFGFLKASGSTFINLFEINNNSSESDITINNYNDNPINNNTYNNNYIIIYNDGDYYESQDEPSTDQTPGGGGGGDPGGGDDSDYDPYPDGGGPSTPGSTTTGSDGVFTLPDIGFDFPQIDWSLKNIGDKFPFCIPSDIVSVLMLLNADPEAPKLQATIPIPHVYDWEIDIDFSEYDSYAAIVRTVEFLGFVISLIYLTIRMVKG